MKYLLTHFRQLTYNNRIEYQLLQTQKNLLQYNLKYAQWSFLPDLSLFANYNLNYQNNRFSKIYSQSFPNSYAGLLLISSPFPGW